MFCYAVLIVSVPLVHGCSIIGGRNASIEEFPYQASIQYFDKHLCGGSILGPNKILTAAYCTTKLPLGNIKVRAGSAIIDKGGQLLPLSKKCEHPDFNIFMYKNNVAVLTLATSLEFSSTVQPINIAQCDIPICTSGSLTGWGILKADGGGYDSKTLQMLRVVRVTNYQCSKAYGSGFNPETMVCFQNQAGEGGCGNDLGGPVVVDGKQVGLVASAFTPCNRANLVLYSKLSYFKDLIESW